MAQVDLTVGGFTYLVSCRDGEEDHLRALGQSLAEKIDQARAAVGNPGEARQLLLAALLFADENKDLRASLQIPSSPAQTNQAVSDDPALLALVERMERLASSLENSATCA